jgi:hypothetical protein
MTDDPDQQRPADDGTTGERRRRLEDLAERAVDAFMTLVRRGTALAVGTFAIVVFVCVGAFALGVAALDDGMEVVWIVLGGFGAFVAIGSVALAMFRLWAIKQLSTQLVEEVYALVSSDARSERVVIETVESSDGVQDQSAVVMSRQFFTMQDSMVGKAGQFVALTAALRAVTSYPLLMVLAAALTFGYAILGMLFAIGLLL